MTMSPERFRDLLDQSTAEAPPAPPAFTDVEAGRSRLRQRRFASVAAGALAVLVVAGGVGIATRGSTEGRGQDPIDPIAPPSASSEPISGPGPPDGLTDARLLRSCDTGRLPRPYFDGAEKVAISQTTYYQAVLAIESADGRYWAECTVVFGGRPDRSPFSLPYDSAGTIQGFQSSTDTGCIPVTSACRYYAWSTVNRVSPEVASVEVELTDGSVQTFPAVRGHYVINLLQPLPEGASVSEKGQLLGLDGRDTVHRITYLDASGTALAAAALDGSGTGEGGFEVDGLPLLWDAYPAMKLEL